MKRNTAILVALTLAFGPWSCSKGDYSGKVGTLTIAVPSLDQTLIGAMKDEAQGVVNNNLTPEKTVPDFLQYIYIDGLKAVKPEAVNIIR